MKWYRAVAKKILDDTINSSSILKGTILPIEASTIPNIIAFNIEWPDFIYREQIGSL